MHLYDSVKVVCLCVNQTTLQFIITVGLGIRFDQASQSVTEGDVVTISIIADHIAVANISIILQLSPLTASGT